MNRLIKYIFALILFFGANLQAQYLFNKLTKDQGLGTDNIKCMVTDRQGFIWLGTDNGLFRFDGTDVTVFQHNPNDSTTISENIILSLFCDGKGNIFAGTRDKGVNIIDPLTLTIKHVSVSDGKLPGLSSVQHKMIFEDKKGDIVISCSYTGIDIYDPISKSLTNYKPTDQLPQLPPRQANCIISGTTDPSNPELVWLGSLDGIFAFNTASKKFFHFPITLEKSENPELFNGSERGVRDLLFCNENELWFASWGGGICKLNTQTGRFVIYKYEEVEPVNGYRNNVRRIVRKSKNELWFAAQFKGLGTINTETGETRFISSQNGEGPAVLHPSDIIFTGQGQLFVGSFSNGLYFTQINAHLFNKKYLPYKLISGTGGNNNDFWAGTYARKGKLLHIDLENTGYREFGHKPKNNHNDNFFVDILNSDTCLWLVESYGLYSFDLEKENIEYWDRFKPKKYFTDTIPIPGLLSASLGPNGNIWIGTKSHGVFCVNPLRGTTISYFSPNAQTNNIDFSEYVFSVFTDADGRTWYGSANFGFFDPTVKRFTNFFYPGNFPESPVKLKKVYAFAETGDDRIWLGTENAGIAVLKTENGHLSYSTSYTRKNGLPDNQTWDLISDKDNNVWAKTSKGLSKINSKTGRIENYGLQYGLQNIHFLSLLDDGRIFAGSTNGYYLFHPDSIEPVINNTVLYIKSIKVFDKEIAASVFAGDDHQVAIKHNEDFFSVEYGLINYFNDKETIFYYKLEGFDEKWHNAGTRSYFSYTNVKGGDYTLKIKSSYGNQINIPIFVQTPYWEKWWFYLFLVLLLSGLVFSLYSFRLRQFKKREELKTAYDKKISQLEIKALRAQMNPHFLFNSLNSIRYYILKKDNDNASEYITKFSKLLRQILNNSRNSQISLKDELYALDIYIGFEQMRFNDKFDYKISVDPAIDQENIKIQPMTIQPFVENAIWHGLMQKKENGILKVGVSMKGKNLVIAVEDNGIGRQKAKELSRSGLKETKSFGIQIAEDRMNMMENIRGKRSDFKIIDLFENKHPVGTKVLITFEL